MPNKTKCLQETCSPFCVGRITLDMSPALEWDWYTHLHSFVENRVCLCSRVSITNIFLVKSGSLHPFSFSLLCEGFFWSGLNLGRS